MDRDPPPPVVSAGPVALLALGGAALAYLLTKQPQIARLVLPMVDSAELVRAAPAGRDLCTKNSDCGSGCSCDRGRCTCTGRAPSGGSVQRKPPAVSMAGTLCTDCLALPWRVDPVQTWPERYEGR